MVWSMASANSVHEMRMCLVLSPLTVPQKGQSSGIEGTCMRAEVHQPFRKVLRASNLESFFSFCMVAMTSSVETSILSPRIVDQRLDTMSPIKKGGGQHSRRLL